jgi:hypothetical protein
VNGRIISEVPFINQSPLSFISPSWRIPGGWMIYTFSPEYTDEKKKRPGFPFPTSGCCESTGSCTRNNHAGPNKSKMTKTQKAKRIPRMPDIGKRVDNTQGRGCPLAGLRVPVTPCGLATHWTKWGFWKRTPRHRESLLGFLWFFFITVLFYFYFLYHF